MINLSVVSSQDISFAESNIRVERPVLKTYSGIPGLLLIVCFQIIFKEGGSGKVQENDDEI
jgi:hypothetical protein